MIGFYTTYGTCFQDIKIGEEGVIELKLDREDGMNEIRSARIIDFDENGSNPHYLECVQFESFDDTGDSDGSCQD